MELLIVICLLMSIFLFVQDKIVSKKRSKQKSSQVKGNLNLPDIMGQPKPVRSHAVPKTATDRQIQEPEINTANLDIEYDENFSMVPYSQPIFLEQHVYKFSDLSEVIKDLASA